MKNYLHNLLGENNIDLKTTLSVNGASGSNVIPVGVVVEYILITTKAEQRSIRDVLVAIDYKNGDIMHFIKHLALAIAK